MKTYQKIKPVATIDTIIDYAETLLDLCFTKVKKNRYNGLCPFHADTENSLMVYVNKDGEVRFHCFGACKGDWDIYDLIMLRRKYRFSRNYSDTLAGPIVFPIYDSDGLTTGLVGRHTGHRGVRWLKQQTREVPLSDRAWLYGIEKAAPCIRQYRTIILVEGILDYFAFYNLLQDQDKPLVVSTLGSYVTRGAAAILKDLDIEHIIVAYDWDQLGRNSIERMAAKSNGWVYYLGGLNMDQAPYDLLKPVADAISGFSMEHPTAGARCAGNDRR